MIPRKTLFGAILFLGAIAFRTHATGVTGCADAGLAAASSDSICYEDTINLSLTGYVATVFQWQSYNGSTWANETGPGSNTPSYDVVPAVSKQYRAIVGDVGCPDDTSNIVVVTVGVMAVPTGTGGTRCGAGTVMLQATPPPGLQINWYATASGPGQPLFMGTTFTTPVITATTTYYAASLSGGVTPVLLTENFESGTTLPAGWSATGLWHITGACSTGSPPNPTKWAYYGVDGQCDFDFPAGQANTGDLTSPVIPIPGAAQSAELRFRFVYDGENGTPPTGYDNASLRISQNGGPFTQVLAITGPNTPTNVWTLATVSLGPYIGSNIQLQWNFATVDGVLNNYLGLQIDSIIISVEGACESPRIPVTATVTPSTPISISGDSALCLGQSTVLTVTSANPNYMYTWSPATGLSATTGAMVTANPTMPITYTVLADDGTCGALDTVFVDVGPTSVSGSATVSTDTICFGTNTTLFTIGSVGTIQWQSNSGSGWVNETGPGSDSSQYTVSPPVSTNYWAVVTSGGCDPDTTVMLHVEVITVNDPVTVNDTICGPGPVNLTASGMGALYWYSSPTGGSPIDTGVVYSANISSTTTYYVEAISGGGSISVGPPNNGFGNQNSNTPNNFGLQFDVTQQITLERVYIYSQTAGNLTINLRAVQNGTILNTITVPINAFVAHYPINLGWSIGPGAGYRLEAGPGSPSLYYNSSGATYPYTFANAPVSITGFLNPAPSTGGTYYYFYDWVVNPGCKSSRIPVSGVVLTPPPVPTITVAGNQFTSSSATNNQWYLNGTAISGATGQVYVAGGPGSYTVVVTDPNGCSSESLPVVFTAVEEANASRGVVVYPNPAGDKVQVRYERPVEGALSLLTLEGKVVAGATVEAGDRMTELNLEDLPAGMYVIRIVGQEGSWVTRFARLK